MSLAAYALSLLAAVSSPPASASCELPHGGETVSAELAETYVAVARFEEEAGQVRTAFDAYSEALRLDPGNEAARAGALRLCSALELPDARRIQDEALALLVKGEPARALASLEGATGSSLPLSALLRGIARYELGQYERAAQELRAAALSPELAPTAAHYRGLLAYREGRSREAAQLFELARTVSQLDASASELRKLAVREGRLNVGLRLGAEADTNPTLLPDTTPDSRAAADVAYVGSASVETKPFGLSGPFARARASWREQRTFALLDSRGIGGELGYRHQGSRLDLLGVVGFQYLRLGAEGYLRQAHVDLHSQLTLSPVVLALRYAGGHESYLPSWAAPYSGLRHRAVFELGVSKGRFRAVALYGGARAAARLPELAYLEHGPGVRAEVRLAHWLRLAGDASWSTRRYDVIDPGFQALRQDTYMDAGFGLLLDVYDRWTVSVGGSARQAGSNVESLRYQQLRGALSLTWSSALL